MYSLHSLCFIHKSSGGVALLLYLLRQPEQTLMLPPILHKVNGVDGGGGWLKNTDGEKHEDDA